MMRRFSLSQRLTLLFTALLLLCATVACAVQLTVNTVRQCDGAAPVGWRSGLCSGKRFWMRRAGWIAAPKPLSTA
ncbi:MAG: hypothetical protein ACLTXH_02830 [Enterobacter hormaechei]